MYERVNFTLTLSFSLIIFRLSVDGVEARNIDEAIGQMVIPKIFYQCKLSPDKTSRKKGPEFL